MLLEEHETHEAALWALAHDYLVLLADADRSCSRGYLRGMFSEGARPVPEDDAMSGRARGVPSQSCINHAFPHQVAVRVIDGQGISEIRSAGAYSSLCQWRHKVGDGHHTFEIFLFCRPDPGQRLRELIVGEAFDYRDQVGPRWDRGRGARRDARRR
jgi:hypothetical protein